MKLIFNITENKNKATFQQEVVKINTSFNQTQNIVKPKLQTGYYPLPVNLENYYTKSETYSQKEINDFLSNKQNTIGYTPENLANKSDSYTVSSSTTYSSTKALVDGLATKQNILTNPITGIGTANYIPKFSKTSTIGDSQIEDDGTAVKIGSPLFNNRRLNINGIGRATTFTADRFAKDDLQGASYFAPGTTSTLSSQGNLTIQTVNSNSDILIRPTRNVGIGPTSPTEKLEIAGRTKSDGQVFNETTSAILPKEIKFKDGKFKAALADGVEKSIAFEGDVGTNLLKSYTHSSNQIIRIQSIDYSTSIATCVSPHGLTGIVQVGIFADYLNNINENFNNIWRDLRTIPWEYLTADVYVQVIDSITLKICNSSGTAISVNNTTSGYNTGTSHPYNANNLANVYWHIEVLKPFEVTDIPINNKRIIVEIIGGMKIKNQRYLAFDIYDSTNIKKANNPFGTEWTMNFRDYVPLSTFNYGQTNKQSVLFQQKIFVNASTKTAIIDLKESVSERGQATFGLYMVQSAESRLEPNFFPFEINNGIASIKSSDASQGFFCNGTIINIYKA